MSGVLEVTVKLTIDGDVDEFAKVFAEYITEVDYPFESDFGPQAWGGYDGPFVTSCSVHRDGKVLAAAKFPPKEPDDEG